MFSGLVDEGLLARGHEQTPVSAPKTTMDQRPMFGIGDTVLLVQHPVVDVESGRAAEGGRGLTRTGGTRLSGRGRC